MSGKSQDLDKSLIAHSSLIKFSQIEKEKIESKSKFLNPVHNRTLLNLSLLEDLPLLSKDK